MLKDSISFDKTGYFSTLICDYINQDNQLSQFYKSYPSDAAFLTHAQQRVSNFSINHRKTLVEVLQDQYKSLETSQATLQNI